MPTPQGLIDIGGGFGVVNPEQFTSSGSSGIRDAVSIMNLQQNAIKLPLELQKLEADIENLPQERRIKHLDEQKRQHELTLVENDIANIELDNAMKRIDYDTKISDENRARSKFLVDQTKNLIEVIRINPTLGAQVLKTISPNAQLVPEGKAFKAVIPVPNGKDVELVIDPNKVLDPQDRLRFEDSERKDFVSNSKLFQVRSQAFRDMLALKDDATGVSDLAMVIKFQNIQDPGSIVHQGEVLTAQQQQNLPSYIRTRYEKAIKEGGPMFGRKESKERQAFIDTVTKQMNNYVSDQLAYGRNVVDIARSRGLEGRSVVAPIGGLTVEDFLPVEELTTEQKLQQLKRLKNLGVR